MNKVRVLIFILFSFGSARAQSDVQPIFDAEKAFEQTAAQDGIKAAYLRHLADDSIIFRPAAVNGKEFWKTNELGVGAVLVRNPFYADVAANGLMGFITGSWELYPKGRTGARTDFGEYVTIWEKKPDGKFRASLDIAVKLDETPPPPKDKLTTSNSPRDANRSGWSVADAAMNFLRLGMSQETMGGAYKKFAADDVRLLREGDPPLSGKKHVVSAMKSYTSVDFPKKVNLYESADMAYVWNGCEYANNDEGTVKGNCLHIWKLRDKKWLIVLGVFAPFPNDTPPVLKTRKQSLSSR